MYTRPLILNLTIEIEEGNNSQRKTEVTIQEISSRHIKLTSKGFLHRGTLVRIPLDMLPHCPVLHGLIRECVYAQGTHNVIVRLLGKTEISADLVSKQ